MPATLRRVGVVIVVVALAASRQMAAPAAADDLPGGPLYPSDFPDPFVLRVGPTYYAYATNGGRGNVQVIRSIDLRTWAPLPDAMPRLPRWASTGHTWAPSVVATGPSSFVAYFTARDTGTGMQCIGRGIATRPEGPFTDALDRPLVCQADLHGSIDPSPFVDIDGSMHLLFKSEGIDPGEPTRVWSVRLTPDGLALAGPAMELVATDQTWEEPIIEGPSMVVVDGSYFLLYAGNRWETPGYAIGYAKCAGPEGPCVKDGSGPLLSSSGDRAGPGAPETVRTTSGDLFVTYHAWSPGRVGYPGGARTLRAAHLYVVDNHLALTTDPRPGDDGYRMFAADGGVFAFGASAFFGSAGDLPLKRPVVGGVTGPAGEGYWLVASDGGVFSYGSAEFYGSTGNIRLNKPIVGMASTPTGRGYWLVASDGGIFAYGDARFYGSTGNIRLNKPIVGMAATPTGRGYWLVATDGGIFAYGDARFFGSTGAITLTSPIVSLAARPWSDGYWIVAADGGVFAFGAAPFFGSLGASPPRTPVVNLVPMPSGDGYRLATAGGAVVAFGRATVEGGVDNQPLQAPVVALAA